MGTITSSTLTVVFLRSTITAASHQKNRGVDRRNMKRIFECRGDGISDHLADAEPADQTGQRKENCRNGVSSARLSGLLCHIAVDIISRTTPVSPHRGSFFFVKLRQSRLNKGSR